MVLLITSPLPKHNLKEKEFSLLKDLSIFGPTIVNSSVLLKNKAKYLPTKKISELAHSQDVLVNIDHKVDQSDLISIIDGGYSGIILPITESKIIKDLVENFEIIPGSVILSSIGHDLDISTITVSKDIPIIVDSIELAQKFIASGFKIYLSGKPLNLAEISKSISNKDVILGYIINYESLPTTSEEKWDYFIKSVVEYFLTSLLISDRPDGLFTTVVTDNNGLALGLCYSNIESITLALRNKQGIYNSRKRGIWYKGESSGNTQKLIKFSIDCDADTLKFQVIQENTGFCHLNTWTCFREENNGLNKLENTILNRIKFGHEGSYTARLLNDESLLNSKILEEAKELVDAKDLDDIIWEAGDLFYFSLVKILSKNLSLNDINRHLDLKSRKIVRRKGDAKPEFIKSEEPVSKKPKIEHNNKQDDILDEKEFNIPEYDGARLQKEEITKLLKRPIQKTEDIMKLVIPIVDKVKKHGDSALLELTAKFDKVELKSPVINAPFPKHLYDIPKETKDSIDIAFNNIKKFHEAQLPKNYGQKNTYKNMDTIETMPGVKCSRFLRPIDAVGLYIPGGTAVLPSTALMLGIPAMVAGCKTIVVASPPRKDGSISPEVAYVAQRVGAKQIVLAGGAQAVASMAYGTESVPKCDKIFGPGNQFVTAAKMMVQNDTQALVAIDMPAGPSEVLVIADKDSNPELVASDLLSQAEHGVDSQVVLLGAGISTEKTKEIYKAVQRQAHNLPDRQRIVKACLEHSVILRLPTLSKALEVSNEYAPEHLILHVEQEEARKSLDDIKHAGSVFVGAYAPESAGDYASGTNHTLPTYGYAKTYSGVGTLAFTKNVTAQELTKEGLSALGPAVMRLAEVEGLYAHRYAVAVRLGLK